MSNSAEVASTIIDQLGGMNKLVGMVGASSFAHSDTNLGGVSFKFKMNRKMNYCRVVLDFDDTYTVSFLKASPKYGVKVIQEQSNVYCDELIPLFEKTTGLYLHL